MLLSFFIVLVVLNLISGAPTNNTTMEGMVQRGIPIALEQFSFAVLLRFRETHPRSCGASLIMVQIVITAATCTEEFHVKTGLTTAYLGNIIPRRSSVIRKAVNYRAHPKFKRHSMTNNMALMFLDQPVVFSSTVKKVVLPGRHDFADDDMIGFGIGWGRPENIRPPDNVLNREALETQQKVIPEDHCNKALHIRLSHDYGPIAFCTVPSVGSFQNDEIGSGLVFRRETYMYLGGVLSHVDDSRIGIFSAIISDNRWIEKASLQLYKESCDKRHH